MPSSIARRFGLLASTANVAAAPTVIAQLFGLSQSSRKPLTSVIGRAGPLPVFGGPLRAMRYAPREPQQIRAAERFYRRSQRRQREQQTAKPERGP